MKCRKIVAENRDYDPADCANTGHRWTLYADGSVAAERYSRWQDSDCGGRWRTEPGYLDDEEMMDPIDSLDREIKRMALNETAPCEDRAYRETRCGFVVK